MLMLFCKLLLFYLRFYYSGLLYYVNALLQAFAFLRNFSSDGYDHVRGKVNLCRIYVC